MEMEKKKKCSQGDINWIHDGGRQFTPRCTCTEKEGITKKNLHSEEIKRQVGPKELNSPSSHASSSCAVIPTATAVETEKEQSHKS